MFMAQYFRAYKYVIHTPIYCLVHIFLLLPSLRFGADYQCRLAVWTLRVRIGVKHFLHSSFIGNNTEFLMQECSVSSWSFHFPCKIH